MGERHRIGIDLGGTKIEGVVLGPTGEVGERVRVPTEREQGYAHIVDRLVEMVGRLRPHAPDAACVGIGTPGSRSARDGTMKNSNTTCLNGRPLYDDLAAHIDLPLVMENDANCFVLAEALHGAGRGHRVVFGVILGTGVGGGIVIDGRVWSGPHHIAGEWGHHRIDPSGPECYCGERGCVEAFLSGPALERAYESACARTADAAEIVRRAAGDDAAAAAVLAEYLERFGCALANVVNVLDPDVVVLGGGLSNMDALLDRGRDAVVRRIFDDAPTLNLARHQLGDSAGVVGAALLG